MEPLKISAQDTAILRELAKQYAEIAHDEVNQERVQRIKDMHSLKQVRPPLWFEQLPWHELNVDNQLTLRSESPFARNLEWALRETLFRWKYFQGDMVVSSIFYIQKAFTESSMGISIQENTAISDYGSKSGVISHDFHDQLDTEEKVDALKIPVIQAQPAIDREKRECASETFDGILPVEIRGHAIYYNAWDLITRFRGITNCLADMIENPELVHHTIKKFEQIYTSKFIQMQEQGLLDFRFPSMNCTPTYAHELPAKDYDGGTIRFKDLWWCGTAQLMVSASPAMNEEFNLQYLKPFMAKCGMSYYGCCEPLDKVIPYLKKIPNLRKIGASPWTNLKSQAEQMGADYVLSRKPNPALVARVIDPDAIKKEITETIEICRENKTPFEYILKDISTVNSKVENLVEWTRIVTGVIDSYY
jgi:hypothetical protein